MILNVEIKYNKLGTITGCVAIIQIKLVSGSSLKRFPLSFKSTSLNNLSTMKADRRSKSWPANHSKMRQTDGTKATLPLLTEVISLARP